MTYQSESPYDRFPIEVWQDVVWSSLASPCIFGFACAVFMQSAALSSFSTNYFRTAETATPVDANSFAIALDFVNDATDAARTSPSAVPSKLPTSLRKNKTRSVAA
jgi:hypothetical protein